jgi:aryl-alcohol dehydrogenase-like predicted oxidoreductase
VIQSPGPDLEARVRFGATDMEVSRLGFGAWAAGGSGYAYGWGSHDDGSAIDAIRAAVAAGINWIETAPIYGLGHSERVVGRALSGMPEDERPYVFTKCGLMWDADRPNDPAQQIGRPDSIRREAEDSLRRLGVDRLDLLQMHWPPLDGTEFEEYWGTLLELKQEGKTRAVGLSNHSLRRLKAGEPLGHVDSFQPPLSLIKRRAFDELVPWCAEHRTAVIGYSPLQSGLLSGSFTSERVQALADNDWRRESPDFTEPNVSRNLALVDALGPIAAELGVTVRELAIAWVLSHEGVTGVIVGARTPAHVQGWMGALGISLDPVHLEAISSALDQTGAGEGPTR